MKEVDTKIQITSYNKTSSSTSNSDFSVILPRQINNIRSIHLDNIMIPNTWYTIMTGINDTFTFTNDVPTTYSATLTQGNYTGPGLATMLETVMNSAYTPDNNFTVTFDSSTYKLTITHGATDFLINASGNANKTLGFTSATSLGLSSVSDSIIYLSYTKSIKIYSEALSDQRSFAGKGRNAIIYTLPCAGSFGSTSVYYNTGTKYVIYPLEQDIKEIDIQIRFDDGKTVIPLNGHDVEIDITVVHVV